MTRARSKALKAASLASMNPNGRPVYAKPTLLQEPVARTDNQQDLIDAIAENDITIVEGIAGCGKTHIGVGTGASMLKQGKVTKLYFTRPVVEAGEKLGFLPGSLDEKVAPYLMPIFDELGKFMTSGEIKDLIKRKVIEVLPLAYMRGRNLDNAYIYADECQNATPDQLRMLLSRIGEGSKLVVAGDSEQSDLRFEQKTYYKSFVDGFDQFYAEVPGLEVIFLDESDIQRHKIIGPMLKVLKKINSKLET